MAGVSAAKPQPGEAADEASHEAAEAAAHLAASARIIGTDDPALAGFFASFTKYASPEDLIRYTGPELAALIKLVFKRSVRRAPGTSLIETFAPASEDPSFGRAETILLAVNDDMPFLYDSCTAAARAGGAHIRAAFHPVIATARDSSGARSQSGKSLKESIIVLALDPLDDDERARLHASLGETFAHVRTAVRDWKPMVKRLRDTIELLKKKPPTIPRTNSLRRLRSWVGLPIAISLSSAAATMFTTRRAKASSSPSPTAGLGFLPIPRCASYAAAPTARR